MAVPAVRSGEAALRGTVFSFLVCKKLNRYLLIIIIFKKIIIIEIWKDLMI